MLGRGVPAARLDRTKNNSGRSRMEDRNDIKICLPACPSSVAVFLLTSGLQKGTKMGWKGRMRGSAGKSRGDSISTPRGRVTREWR